MVTGGNIEDLLTVARQRAAAATEESTLERLRVELLGKKGAVTAALRGLGALPRRERASMGARTNALKGQIESVLE